MIDENEFEKRVEQWYGMVIKALQDNLQRAIDESWQLEEADINNPEFLVAMEDADIYRMLYLPEKVLAHFLDPKLPSGFFDTVSRSDFLLQEGMTLCQAKLIASHIIAVAKQGPSGQRHN
jgi:hypothetical protein